MGYFYYSSYYGHHYPYTYGLYGGLSHYYAPYTYTTPYAYHGNSGGAIHAVGKRSAEPEPEAKADPHYSYGYGGWGRYYGYRRPYWGRYYGWWESTSSIKIFKICQSHPSSTAIIHCVQDHLKSLRCFIHFLAKLLTRCFFSIFFFKLK